jgi:predicted nucleotidyltransferase
MGPEALVEAVSTALADLDEVRLCWVFGSRIAGRPRPDSDLDVAVWLAPVDDERRRVEILRAVIDRLAHALGELGERTDVVELDRADPGVAFAAIRDGRLAIARSDRERVLVVARLSRAYDDDAPRRELYRRAAIEVGRRLAAEARGHR